MLHRVWTWLRSAKGANNLVALEPVHPQESCSPEGTWESLVPGCPDNVAYDVLQEGDDADFHPSTSTEPKSSTPRRPHETSVENQLAQPNAMDGTWVAEGIFAGMRADLSFVTIAEGSLITANLDTFRLGQGSNPHSVAFADAGLSLQADGVMRLCAASGEVALFKRVDAQCRTTFASLQGRWKSRGESRHQRKVMTIQGALYELSFQYFGQHRTSKGMLRWQNETMAIEEFKLSIIAHGHFTLQSPSGHVWRFTRER